MRLDARDVLLWRFALFHLLHIVSAQSVPGASHFVGGGVPGGRYELVDNYSPSIFFQKFNYYNVSNLTSGINGSLTLGRVPIPLTVMYNTSMKQQPCKMALLQRARIVSK